MIELAILFLAPIVAGIPVAIAWGRRPESELAKKLPVISVLGLFVSLVVSLYLFFSYPEPERVVIQWIPGLNINFTFIFDYLSTRMGVLTAFIAFLIGFYGLEYMKHDYRMGWYWFFFNTFTSSMLLVVYSDNLLMLLIGWEGLGLASWGLIGHWFMDDDELSYVGVLDRIVGPLKMFWSPSTGGWRAISTIRFGDMPMFFAVAAIFALTGSLDISQIEWGALFTRIGTAGTIVLLLAFLMGPFTKSAQLPFSEWLMTAMTGPTTVSALLHSATMVAAGTYLFMRLSLYIEPWAHQTSGLAVIYILVLFLGLISALYGSLVALSSLERKVILAASTMSSLGLMFATTASSYWLGELAVLIAFWYLIVHAFAKATLFLVAGHLIHVTETRFCSGNLEFGKKLIVGFGATVLATISLAGIPPLTAYWVKSGMDELMHGLHEEFGLIPFTLLILTSLVYSGFLAKFLSLNFIKGEKPHEVHLHGGKVMSLAYAVMVSMLLYLLYVILTGNGHLLEELVGAGFDKASLSVGILVLVAYVVTLINPRERAFSKIAGIFGDRLYLSALNDYLVPGIGKVVIAIVDSCNSIIDFFFHRFIPDVFGAISGGIRSLQKGYLTVYLKLVIGVFLVVLFITVMVGW